MVKNNKKRFPIWLIVLLVIFGLFLLSSLSFLFMPLRYLPFYLMDKIRHQKISVNLPGKQVLKTRKPTPIPDKAVRKKIIAKDGGELVVYHPKGYTVRLFIPPNSLSQDTEITLTPNEDDSIIDEPQDDDDIGVTVDPPVGFDPPATVDFVPGEPPSGEIVTDGAGAGVDTAEPPLGDWQASVSSPSPENPAGSQTSPYSFVVFVGRSGPPQVIPTHHDPEGYGFGGNINSGGDVTGNDDPTQDDLQNAADQAAANASGQCTDEFLQAVMALINYLKNQPGTQAEQARTRYGQLLEECENQCLQQLEERCQNNRTLLRRQQFSDCYQTIVMIGGLNDKAQRVLNLEENCTAEYEFFDSRDHPQSQDGITLKSTLDAKVCGYVDDPWEGNYRYDTIANVAGGSGDHYIISDTQFSLPPLGGSFDLSCRNTQSALELMGTIMPIPLPDAFYTGYFDGLDNLNVNTYADIRLENKIKLKSLECGSNVPAPPGSLPLPLGN